MCSMRVSKITCAIDLLRFYFTQQFHRDPDVFFAHWFFLDRARFIEWQVLKMNICIFNTHIAAGSPCLTSSYQSLDRTDGGGVDLVGFFSGDKFPRVIKNFPRFPGVNASYLFKPDREVEKPCYELICHRNITRCLVG